MKNMNKPKFPAPSKIKLSFYWTSAIERVREVVADRDIEKLFEYYATNTLEDVPIPIYAYGFHTLYYNQTWGVWYVLVQVTKKSGVYREKYYL